MTGSGAAGRTTRRAGMLLRALQLRKQEKPSVVDLLRWWSERWNHGDDWLCLLIGAGVEMLVLSRDAKDQSQTLSPKPQTLNPNP